MSAPSTITTEHTTNVTFFNVKPRYARAFLARAFAGSIDLKEGEELDTYQVEYELTDEQALEWMQLILIGYEMGFTTVYHQDGTKTHYPTIKGA